MKPFFPISRIEQLLEDADMQAILFCRPSSFFYFTTLPWYEFFHFYEAPGTHVIPISGYVRGEPDAAFATASSQMDFPDFKAQGIWISDIRPIMGSRALEIQAERIVGILEEKGVRSGRVGIERDPIAHGLIENLERMAPDIQWVECREVLHRLQEFKAAEELARLKTACQITGRGMMEVFDALETGVTPEEMMDVFIRSTTGLYMGRWGHFFAIHFKDNHFTGKELKSPELEPGTLIHIDCCRIYKGLIADLGRNFYFGASVPPEVEKCSQACIKTVSTVLDRIKPGIACTEVHKLSEETLFDLLGDTEGVDVGFHSHGIGWILYSYPIISPRPDPEGTILPGHAFTLEVKVKYPGFGHFKCEDTFAMHEDGPECITDLERKLFVKPA